MALEAYKEIFGVNNVSITGCHINATSSPPSPTVDSNPWSGEGKYESDVSVGGLPI
jgi:hypothetical protein